MSKIFERIFDLLLTLCGVTLFIFWVKKNPYRKNLYFKNYQFNKIKKLLHKASKIKYYENLFSQLDFNVNRDFKSLKDLEKLPILSKNQLKKNIDSFYSNSNHSLTLFTSGSTGIPTKIKVSYFSWIVEQAVVWRHWSWAGYRFRNRMAIIRSYVPKNGKLIKYDRLRNFDYYSPFHLSESNVVFYLENIIKRKTKFLRGYPTSIKIIAEAALKHNIIPEIKGVFVASEVLSKADSDFISSVFKCPVYNHYGLADVSVMMGSCGMGKNYMHIYQDYGYVELIKDTKLKDNQRRIIATHLHNDAMPLIRYDTGDIAEMTDSKCGCDLNFPTVKKILGRSDGYIINKHNTKIPTVNFYTLFEYYLEIVRWQIIQKTKTNLIINIKVKNDRNFSVIELKKNLISDLENRLGSDFDFDFKINEGFELVNEGKFNTFISKI